MIKYILIISAAVFFGLIVGIVIGVSRMSERASDGICIRAEDGEVYLKISESGQQKLADPTTKLLYLRVVSISTRNNHVL